MDYYQESLKKHAEYKGKLEIKSKVPLNDRNDLSLYYTPGVAQPCLEIAKDPEKAYEYTWKGNAIAIVSDGSAVLGLGNIWWLAGLPVMEGKSILFKEFGWVDCVPIVLNTQDPDKIIEIVEAISPTFGGINLEDISAPNCFYIEEELKKRLSIPVFHDDQHGTAIVVLAGLINALKLTGKNKETIKVVINGSWAAGTAIAKLLATYGVKNIISLDSKWAISSERTDLNKYKKELLAYNINDEKGELKDILPKADMFVWVSKGNLLTREDIATMNEKSIVFGMANPIPEILPDEAKAWGAYIVATGRSDFPNQINNLLVFPGIFRWILDARIPQVEDKHKLAAAIALANYVQTPTPEMIIPSPLDKGVANIIAEAVKNA
ncbi:MAG: hypothetical protein ACD_80C00102G0015 [uncultured bacterium (gcode 4)]|uniref:Uncharacterized protein n=1 Tax=uncultured bacterium (gcode 4) TaxID=1234023 RepID=K1XY10_9BACT|nr:MAG: hypothetical protein ACD_80C00102G0015 [uncultured bacterium (gcode 4)]